MRLGELQRARDLFEEGLASVEKMRDFIILFRSFCDFERGVIKVRTKQNYCSRRSRVGGASDEVTLSRLDMLLKRRMDFATSL